MKGLLKNDVGRYELDGRELTSGSAIEVWLAGRWIAARIEHDNDRLRDYYIAISGGGALIISESLEARLPESR